MLPAKRKLESKQHSQNVIELIKQFEGAHKLRVLARMVRRLDGDRFLNRFVIQLLEEGILMADVLSESVNNVRPSLQAAEQTLNAGLPQDLRKTVQSYLNPYVHAEQKASHDQSLRVASSMLGVPVPRQISQAMYMHNAVEKVLKRINNLYALSIPIPHHEIKYDDYHFMEGDPAEYDLNAVRADGTPRLPNPVGTPIPHVNPSAENIVLNLHVPWAPTLRVLQKGMHDGMPVNRLELQVEMLGDNVIAANLPDLFAFALWFHYLGAERILSISMTLTDASPSSVVMRQLLGFDMQHPGVLHFHVNSVNGLVDNLDSYAGWWLRSRD